MIPIWLLLLLCGSVSCHHVYVTTVLSILTGTLCVLLAGCVGIPCHFIDCLQASAGIK